MVLGALGIALAFACWQSVPSEIYLSVGLLFLLHTFDNEQGKIG